MRLSHEVVLGVVAAIAVGAVSIGVVALADDGDSVTDVHPVPTATVTVTATPSPFASHPAHKSHVMKKPLTYVVKPGDNLTVIATWFSVHGGYAAVYHWNRSVIGNDPNLIFPGEKITVSNTGVTSST